MSANLMGSGNDDKGGLPLIGCFCGEDILIIPSIERMTQAIEAHAKKHSRKIKGSKKAKQIEARHVEEFLMAEMFERVVQRS